MIGARETLAATAEDMTTEDYVDAVWKRRVDTQNNRDLAQGLPIASSPTGWPYRRLEHGPAEALVNVARLPARIRR